jgi:CRISPR-associated protein Csd1
MILQALYEYYQRKAADPESGIAPEGFEWKEIPFIIVIDKDGHFVRIEDTREGEGRIRRGKTFLVPRGEGRAGPAAWQNANLLWDHLGYVLGQAKGDEEKNKELAKKQHDAFIGRISSLPESLKSTSGVNAIGKFYDMQQESFVISSDQFQDCLRIAGCNMTFRLEGDANIVTDDPAVKKFAIATTVSTQEGDDENDAIDEEVEAVCLVTGKTGPIARKHNRTSINKDTKALVAVQRHSGYDSYGKVQAYNCPIGKSAEFAYTTALNVLLKSEDNRLHVGDATMVYWAQKKDSVFEKQIKSFFSAVGKAKDDPDKDALDAKANLLSILSGIPPERWRRDSISSGWPQFRAHIRPILASGYDRRVLRENAAAFRRPRDSRAFIRPMQDEPPVPPRIDGSRLEVRGHSAQPRWERHSIGFGRYAIPGDIREPMPPAYPRGAGRDSRPCLDPKGLLES